MFLNRMSIFHIAAIVETVKIRVFCEIETYIIPILKKILKTSRAVIVKWLSIHKSMFQFTEITNDQTFYLLGTD